ncbi:putative quinol monooxygenase [Clostridium sp. MT-14]|jgi:quinol monooxygenase YgiN|uniref:Antibiotic biosynthesis monooxygenase n=1 Tax=Clostridium aromativorans TaxID=2836848 RepID=A0ABS8NCN3_9CLOT|nr:MULTISPECIES: putative quinol monooxygenase [Clostridium]KAA8667925.1 antibiotic biosynthesis monooxygenase [Clostridium sp. HV4-5-A1G]MCC9296478.1 antibiotic biosynthesis monooxygenase [Clostridium aromativorans]CAB1262834.1 Antibiotic biosynthesis monooxygenase [Clostridiaceae bacterium BL-3]
MITIVAKSIIKKGEKEKYLKLAKELIEKSRKENGCISYKIFEEINDSSILTFMEQWKNARAIQEHNNSEHFKRIVPLLAELRVSKSEINTYREL